MKQRLSTPYRAWLYLIVITACILKQDDATNDYPGISGETTRSAGPLDSDTTLTTMTPPGSNPSTTVTASSSSSSTFIVDRITDDNKDGNHFSASDLFSVDRPHTESTSSDVENKGRAGIRAANTDDEFSRGACPPTKSQSAATSKSGVLSSHNSALVALQEGELNVNMNIPKNHHDGRDERASKECRDDIVLMTTEDVPHLARNPISIISQDGKTVTFSISDPFETESPLDTSITTIFYQYVPAETGATTCAAMMASKSSLNRQKPVEITAHCMASPSRQSSLAIVDLWFVDSSTRSTTTGLGIQDGTQSYASLPDKCFHNIHENKEKHDGSILPNHGASFLYSYKIYCQSQCTRSKTLLVEPQEERDPATFSSNALSNKELLTPNKDKQDHFLCDAKDYPCGGDGNMVQVCHYSTRDGYRTHCIPQSESRSLIGYFWKDYCGPCVSEEQGK